MACSTSNNQDECTTDECLKQEAYDKIIKVHDEVMPKLAQVSELKKKIESRINLSEDSVEIEKYTNLMVELDQADESMWIWMRAFNSNIEDMPIDEAMTYLKSEQEKVDNVASRINSSIAEAEAALGN